MVSQQHGFTLVEFVVVLLVAAVLVGLARPPLARAGRRFAAHASARQLAAEIARARQEAVLTGQTVRVVLDTLAGSYLRRRADGSTSVERRLPGGVGLRTTAYREEVLFSARGTSNLHSTTWIGVPDDPGARWHGIRVRPTGSIEGP